MISLYFKERLPWMLYIFLIIIFINILFYIDSGFSNVSKGYFNLIIIVSSFIFLTWRYLQETKEVKKFLESLLNPIEVSSMKLSKLSPFQQKYMECVLKLLEEKDLQLNYSKIQQQEDVEDLLAWVHEMKTPLTALKLMVEQVEEVKLKYKLENEWIKIHLLLDQQLHNSRLATIEKDNRLESFKLRSVVYKEIRDFQSWCLEKGIGFQVDELEEQVTSDKKWLSFIIRQLLSNAIKYSHDNSEINIYTEVDELEHILLHIEDTGIGIKEEDISRIFNKSYTGTIGREFVQSTGMGLYLAQNAAQKLGIQITAKSKVNVGSTFTLKFPNQNEYQNILGR